MGLVAASRTGLLQLLCCLEIPSVSLLLLCCGLATLLLRGLRGQGDTGFVSLAWNYTRTLTFDIEAGRTRRGRQNICG